MTPEGQGIRAAGYVRVSQERSARNGYSLAAQEQEVRRFVDYKGWAWAGLYREEGVSGYRRDRPALERLLADARAGVFSVAVFPSIDRAGRSVRDLIEIDQTLRAAGAATVYLREGVDTSTATGQLFRNIMASLAEFEGRVIHERLSKGRARKASQGGFAGGGIPYGYRKAAGGSLEVVPEQARVVGRVFRWSAEGKSLPWIARHLREEGVPTQKGGTWRCSTVQGILGHRAYTGRMSFEGAFIPGRHQAIVPDALFESCRRQTAD